MARNQRAEIVMSHDEIVDFIEQQRTCTMATVGPGGVPHLVAMWYGVVDQQIWFETKGRSQKVVNLRRDPTISVSIEAGHTYDTLRGISIEGRGVIVEDPDVLWKVGVSVFERYNGPYTEDMKPFVEVMLNKRVAIRVDVDRIRSWDHSKLGMQPMPLAGSTAQYLTQ
jgi:PPOX class probable F420-dependent enzyme